MDKDDVSSSSDMVMQSQDVVAALKNIRTFSLLSIAGDVLDLAAFVIIILSIGVILKEISSDTRLPAFVVPALVPSIFISIVGAILILASLDYLRSEYLDALDIHPIDLANHTITHMNMNRKNRPISTPTTLPATPIHPEKVFGKV